MSSNSSMPSPSNSPPFPVGRGVWGCFFGSSIGGICWGTSVQSPARRLGSRINAKLLTRVEMRSLAGHCQTRQGNARGRVQIRRLSIEKDRLTHFSRHCSGETGSSAVVALFLTRPHGVDDSSDHPIDREIGRVDDRVAGIAGQGRVGTRRVLFVPRRCLGQDRGEVGGLSFVEQFTIPPFRAHFGTRREDELG